MAFYPGLVPLRDVLAEFFFTPGSAKTIVGEAGISAQLIDFSGPAVEYWTNILTIAHANNQVQTLLDVSRKRYPSNEQLAAAEQVFKTTPEPEASSGTTGNLKRKDGNTIIQNSKIQGMVQQNTGSITMTFNDTPEQTS